MQYPLIIKKRSTPKVPRWKKRIGDKWYSTTQRTARPRRQSIVSDLSWIAALFTTRPQSAPDCGTPLDRAKIRQLQGNGGLAPRVGSIRCTHTYFSIPFYSWGLSSVHLHRLPMKATLTPTFVEEATAELGVECTVLLARNWTERKTNCQNCELVLAAPVRSGNGLS